MAGAVVAAKRASTRQGVTPVGNFSIMARNIGRPAAPEHLRMRWIEESPGAGQPPPGRSGQPCESSGWRQTDWRSGRKVWIQRDPRTGEPVSRTSSGRKTWMGPRHRCESRGEGGAGRSKGRLRIGSPAKDFCRTNENPEVPANLIPDRPTLQKACPDGCCGLDHGCGRL